MANLDNKAVALIRDLAKNYSRILDAVNRVLNLRGDGVTNTPAGITISQRSAASNTATKSNRPPFVGYIRVSSGTGGGPSSPPSFKYRLCSDPQMTNQIATDVALGDECRRIPNAVYLAADSDATGSNGVQCEWGYAADGTTPVITNCGEVINTSSCATSPSTDSGDGWDDEDGSDM